MAKWSIPPIKMRDLAMDQLHAAARAIALEIFNRLMVRSPVDTGRFRGNWQIDIQTPAAEALDRLDQAGQETALIEAAKLLQYKLGATIHIRNNLPYAVRLEYGWSGQAPNGMVRITILEAPQIAANVAGALRGQG